jgi:hypothetical protein
VAVKRISQLATISDAALTGEAILPVVVSDPLLPNRKSKVSQLFRGVAAGSKTAPGLAFDLDRDTGLYQNSYNELGVSFGTASLYHRKNSNSDGSTTVIIAAGDSVATNVNLQYQPQGAGFFTVNGVSRFTDANFYLVDDTDQNKRAQFQISGISTGGGIKTFNLPSVGSQTGTTLLGTDTAQTLTNKSIVIVDANLQITGSLSASKIAKFEVDSWDAVGTKTYKLPDLGVSVIEAVLVDDRTVQYVSNKFYVNPLISDTPSNDPQNPTPYVALDSANITANRVAAFPDQNIVFVGEDSNQVLTNKIYRGAVFADTTTLSKRVTFDLSNYLPLQNAIVGFPSTNLNTQTTEVNYFVWERARQNLYNKTAVGLTIASPTAPASRQVVIDTSNLTAIRNIQFPDADATLLSTNNAGSLQGISFGGALGADSFGGRLRLQTYFQAGW